MSQNLRSPGFKKPTALDPGDLARSLETSLRVSLGSVLAFSQKGCPRVVAEMAIHNSILGACQTEILFLQGSSRSPRIVPY